jgi:hypothetical protein
LRISGDADVVWVWDISVLDVQISHLNWRIEKRGRDDSAAAAGGRRR